MKKRLSPYGGIIRIRFNGSNLSLSAPLSKRRQKYKKSLHVYTFRSLKVYRLKSLDAYRLRSLKVYRHNNDTHQNKLLSF